MTATTTVARPAATGRLDDARQTSDNTSLVTISLDTPTNVNNVQMNDQAPDHAIDAISERWLRLGGGGGLFRFTLLDQRLHYRMGCLANRHRVIAQAEDDYSHYYLRR